MEEWKKNVENIQISKTNENKKVNLQISQCFIGNNQGESYQEAILERD